MDFSVAFSFLVCDEPNTIIVLRRRERGRGERGAGMVKPSGISSISLSHSSSAMLVLFSVFIFYPLLTLEQKTRYMLGTSYHIVHFVSTAGEFSVKQGSIYI